MKVWIVALFLLDSFADAYVAAPTIKAGFSNFVADSQPSQKVIINLDIGTHESTSRLAIKGMTLDLHSSPVDKDHVDMPGYNGPHPNLSSGIRKLDLLKQGEFVSLAGVKTMNALKGCWEMVWKEDSPAGALVCGFEITEEYQRNDATLSPGRLYLSFPVWTQDSLAFARAEKDRILAKATEALKEKDAMMEKYFNDPNPFMKALYYRNAYAAAEKFYKQPVKRVEAVPDENEVFLLQDNLLCTTKGTIWYKESPRRDSILMGAASLKPLPVRC